MSKNANISCKFFEVNCRYHSYISFKNKANSHSKFQIVNKIVKKLKKINNDLPAKSILYSRIFKKNHRIKELSSKFILLAKMFDWIINIKRQNRIRSSKTTFWTF